MAPVNVLVVLVVGLSTVSADCLDGWTPFHDFCYRLYRTVKDWPLAKFECEKNDGYLATLDTQQKINDAKALMTMLHQDVNSHVWIGLTDARREGIWVWDLTEKNATILDWGGQEPNGGHGNEQDCAMLYGKNDFTWADDPCERSFEFLCERPKAAPTP